MGNHPVRVLVVGLGNERITFLERLVNGLTGRGMEIHIASSRKPDKARFSHPERVKWLWAPSWEGPLHWRLLNFAALCITRLPSRRLPWLLRQLAGRDSLKAKLLELYRLLPYLRVRADILYFPWNSGAIDYRGLYDLGIPVVVSCRGSQINIRPHLPGYENYREELRQSFAGAAAVHVVSRDILEKAMNFGLDPHKAALIRPAVDPRVFQPPDERKSAPRFTIITTGALIWLKGFEYALLALHELQQKRVDCQFEIIGDGPEKARLLYTLQDLGLESRVSLLGRLPPREVLARLQRADAFLLSSLSEGIANAALEAMSCGLPVVTSDCGGMREAVTDGVEGFVVPLRDPPAMAGALASLAADPHLRARMGQAARERVLRDFDSRQQIDAFEQLFRALSEKS